MSGLNFDVRMWGSVVRANLFFNAGWMPARLRYQAASVAQNRWARNGLLICSGRVLQVEAFTQSAEKEFGSPMKRLPTFLAGFIVSAFIGFALSVVPVDSNSAQAQTCLEAGCSDYCGPGLFMHNGKCFHVAEYGTRCVNESFRAPLSRPLPLNSPCVGRNDEGESYNGFAAN